MEHKANREEPDSSRVSGDSMLEKLIEIRRKDRTDDGNETTETGEHALQLSLSIFTRAFREHGLKSGQGNTADTEKWQDAERGQGGSCERKEAEAETIRCHAKDYRPSPPQTLLRQCWKRCLGRQHGGGRREQTKGQQWPTTSENS